MRLRRIEIAILAAACALGAAVSGCATSGGQKTGDKKYTVVCSDEPPTGSTISRLRCHREIDVQERQRRDHRAMEKIQFETNRAKNVEGQAPDNRARRQLVFQSVGGATVSSRGSGQVR